jgi:hypothetical protein
VGILGAESLFRRKKAHIPTSSGRIRRAVTNVEVEELTTEFSRISMEAAKMMAL